MAYENTPVRTIRFPDEVWDLIGEAAETSPRGNDRSTIIREGAWTESILSIIDSGASARELILDLHRAGDDMTLPCDRVRHVLELRRQRQIVIDNARSILLRRS